MSDEPLPLLPIAFPTPGFYADMPAELYHAIEAMSSGGSQKMLRSPAHYKRMRTERNEPTPAMQFGTVIHAGVLEPHRLADVCAAVPDDAPSRPTSAQLRAKKPSPDTLDAIAYWTEFNARNGGRIILSASDHARAMLTIEAIRAHPGASQLLAGAQIEGSLFWQDSRYGVPCKARFDARNLGGLIDVKSTQDASPEAFARSAAAFSYHVQGAHYCSGARHVFGENPEFFAIIAAETEPPFGVACYLLESNALLAGGHRMSIALGRYAAALSEDRWSGYPSTIEVLRMPAYATKFNV